MPNSSASSRITTPWMKSVKSKWSRNKKKHSMGVGGLFGSTASTVVMIVGSDIGATTDRGL